MANEVAIKALERCAKLVNLLTVKQVVDGGTEAIEAAGLNPWCLNEGRATGEEKIGAWWIYSVLDELSNEGSEE